MPSKSTDQEPRDKPDFVAAAQRLSQEKLYSLAEIAQFIPRCRGKKVHTSSIYRWIMHGKNGVRLDGVQASGSGWFTSREALARFWAGVSEKRLETPRGWTSSKKKT
jgi:hypothetical protein